MAQGGIDLIHAQNVAAQPAAGLAARFAGVPCVWHLRDLRGSRLMARRLVPLASAAVAVSEAVADRWRRELGDRLDIRVVANAIDADAFAARAHAGTFRRELGLTPDDPLMAVVGQMVPWKGHRGFLRAMALVHAEQPRAVAAVAGDDVFGDHPGYPGQLRREAASLGLAGVVRFLGYRDDVPDLMADADLLVVPSDAEPFGRVALEAMALGAPVVGKGSGGLPEVVEDGITGLLTGGDSAEELARLIGDLLGDPARRLAMGEAGRRRVRDRFGMAAHVAAICSIYRRLLSG